MKGVNQMSNSQEKKEKHEEKKEEHSLKGTFVSVMLLGAFLIASWLGVWIIYLIR